MSYPAPPWLSFTQSLSKVQVCTRQPTTTYRYTDDTIWFFIFVPHLLISEKNHLWCWRWFCFDS